MPSTRVMIICFWVFIGGMLLWQFHDFNKGIDEANAEHPKQEHFYFYNTNISNTPAAPKVADGPIVKQVKYTIDTKTPGYGGFTSSITLKNVGNAKAVDVQIWVRPFRGSSRSSAEYPSSNPANGPIPDSDALAQFGQWVSFPDLAPGESNTRNVVFYRQGTQPPGVNPDPQISFHPEKPKP